MTDKSFHIDYPYSNLSSLPHITPSMLLDHLESAGVEIALEPSRARRLFRWFKFFQMDEQYDASKSGLSGTQALFICEADHAQDLFLSLIHI